MKYCGGLFLLTISTFFFVLPVHTFSKVSLEEVYEEPFMLAGILIFWFGILFLKGTYYLFKFAELFTKTIVFSENLILISDRNGCSEEIPTEKISKVVYVKLLYLFEIHFEGKVRKEIILMSGGRSVTQTYEALKEYLSDSNKLKIKWL